MEIGVKPQLVDGEVVLLELADRLWLCEASLPVLFSVGDGDEDRLSMLLSSSCWRIGVKGYRARVPAVSCDGVETFDSA